MKGSHLLVVGILFGGVASETQAADSNWEMVGLEGGLTYSEQAGDYVTPFGSQDTKIDWTSLYVGANFSNGTISEIEPRWVVTPFASYAMDGQQSLPGANATTDFGSGYFEKYEFGARFEREQPLTTALSWSFGASLSYVDIATRDAEPTGYWERKQDGYRAAVFVGLAREISDSGALVGRVGYAFADLNESFECRSNAGGDCNSTPAFADDDTNTSGPLIELGFRRTF